MYAEVSDVMKTPPKGKAEAEDDPYEDVDYDGVSCHGKCYSSTALISNTAVSLCHIIM